MEDEDLAYIASEIWNEGWFQAFLDNKEHIPDNIIVDWNKLQAMCRVIQPKVDTLLKEYPI